MDTLLKRNDAELYFHLMKISSKNVQIKSKDFLLQQLHKVAVAVYVVV